MRGLGLWVLALALVACDDGGGGGGGGGGGAGGAGGDGGGAPPGTGESKTQVIGAQGGDLSHEGLTLAVPAGALPADTEITVTSTADAPQGDFERLSPVFRFEPDGLQFAAPVTVRIAFAGGAREPAVYWASAGQPFARLDSTVEDGAVTAQVTHFSEGFAGDVPAPADPDGGVGGAGGGPAPGGELRPAFHRTWETGTFDPRHLSVADDGDLFLAGSFSGPLDLGSGPAMGQQGTFAARLAPDGTARWLRDGQAVNVDLIQALPGGDVYIAGKRDFARLGPDGADRWRKNYGQGELWPMAATVDAAGNIVTVGIVNGQVDLGGGELRTGLGGQMSYIAIHDPQGNHVFSAPHGGEHSTAHEDVEAIPGGGVYVTGTHFGEVDFGGGPLLQPNRPGTDGRLYVVRFGAGGQHQWSVSYGGAQNQRLDPIAVTADGDGNAVVVALYSTGAIDLGQGPLSPEPLGGTAVLTLAAADGSLLGVRAFAGAQVSRDGLNAHRGQLYLTGALARQVDFGGGPVPAQPLDPAAPVPVGFVAVLGADGEHRLSHAWPSRFEQAPSFQMHKIEGTSLAPDGAGGLWWVARYEGDVELAEGTPLSAGERDVLLVRFAP